MACVPGLPARVAATQWAALCIQSGVLALYKEYARACHLNNPHNGSLIVSFILLLYLNLLSYNLIIIVVETFPAIAYALASGTFSVTHRRVISQERVKGRAIWLQLHSWLLSS